MASSEGHLEAEPTGEFGGSALCPAGRALAAEPTVHTRSLSPQLGGCVPTYHLSTQTGMRPPSSQGGRHRVSALG